MVNFAVLDRCLKRYIKEVKTWSPERLIDINLATLHNLGMLPQFHEPTGDGELTRYFQIAESPDKITLVNEEFVIWIVPEVANETPITYVFIALNSHKKPNLEVTFRASGVYNSSKLVMKILERMLNEIQENEALLHRYTNSAE